MIPVEYLKSLSPDRKGQIVARSMVDFSQTVKKTEEILLRLRQNPEKELLREYGHLAKNLSLDDFLVSEKEISQAYKTVSPQVKEALQVAADNIRRFHEAQGERPMWFQEFSPGLLAGRITHPLERVGVYIPGGRAAYPSSALMNIIPAKVAQVPEIIATTPPSADFTVKPEILLAADLAGADKIFKLGGAWAVGSLAYGLGKVPRVDKIVGPGSSWVTAAKMAVFGQVDIDMPAGPSEGFIIADKSAPAQWLAWDLLSQLEHDPQAAAVLITTDENLAHETARIMKDIFPTLARKEIVSEALKNGAAILVAENLESAFDFANEYAPEHLQLMISNPFNYLTKVHRAGSIFLGPHAPIAAGDYASGPNHVLPTSGTARMFSGLSIDSFLKKITFQHLSPEALKTLAPTVTTLANAEGLFAHAQSVSVRTLEQ
ncbi:MAG: histidinol dehydrogenase [Candidatus Adiutrix sp.]